MDIASKAPNAFLVEYESLIGYVSSVSVFWMVHNLSYRLQISSKRHTGQARGHRVTRIID
jgi:hypothetical protein